MTQAAKADAPSAGFPRATAASDPDNPPAAGWQLPRDGQTGARPGSSTMDLDQFGQAFHALRELIPPELQRRLAEAVHELLVALRALVDWCLERLERRPAEPAEVKDIPIR